MEKMVYLVNPTRGEKFVEKWINQNTDNGFKNDISSLFQISDEVFLK